MTAENIDTSLPVYVIDTSFFAAFLIGDTAEIEFENARNVFYKIVSENGMIFVPQLFWYEIGNVLLNASKPRKDGQEPRITVSDVNDIIGDLKKLPVVTKEQYDTEDIMRIQMLAHEKNLTYYDASYLDLSRQLDIPLLTFDKALKGAI